MNNSYDPKSNPNYLPNEPYAKGVWRGKEIEAFESKAYGCVVFYSGSGEEVDAEIDEIDEVLEALVPIVIEKT